MNESIVPAGLMMTHGRTDCAVILVGMPGSRPGMATLQSPPIQVWIPPSRLVSWSVVGCQRETDI
jgi:hypothetical protein